jgi:peptidyl-prolyl cis-trans isomerase A (cyclophilin A)
MNRLLTIAALSAAALIATACARTPPLLSPDPAHLDAVGPDSFTVHFESSRGAFDVKVHRDWAPRANDRLYYLFRAHYYDGVRFFRTVDNFVSQFGISGDTAVIRVWRDKKLPDDSVTRSNVRGTLSFASGGPNTRTTQLFINYRDNSRLDRSGFAVFGQVISGMEVVDSLYKEYGEGAPRGKGPEQGRIQKEGNAYLIRDFPKLDYVITARVVAEWRHR